MVTGHSPRSFTRWCPPTRCCVARLSTSPLRSPKRLSDASSILSCSSEILRGLRGLARSANCAVLVMRGTFLIVAIGKTGYFEFKISSYDVDESVLIAGSFGCWVAHWHIGIGLLAPFEVAHALREQVGLPGRALDVGRDGRVHEHAAAHTSHADGVAREPHGAASERACASLNAVETVRDVNDDIRHGRIERPDGEARSAGIKAVGAAVGVKPTGRAHRVIDGRERS